MTEDNIRITRDEDDDFLAELESNRFQPPPPAISEKQREKSEAREMKQLIMQQERERKQREKEQKKAEKEAHKKPPRTKADNDTDSLYGDEGTPILGRDKLVMMKKVKQYKSLFPDELSKFKIKRNPSVEDLEASLAEMEVIVETGGIDGFLMDSVVQCIKLVEGVTANTKNYDIRGCADLLKNNKQFHSLCKQLFIKYNVFSAVPCEYQLILLVSTTAYMCTQKNKNKDQLNGYLDAKI
jgi:hypothetical protein